MTAWQHPRWTPIAVAGLAALTVAMVGGAVTELGPWYQGLRQPDWKPPDWLFGPVWTVIFGLTAWSAATAWRAAPHRVVRTWVVALFSLNAALNVLWSWLFFSAKRPDWALVEVFLLWLSILMLAVLLFRFSRTASWLLIPYLVWVTFAGVLNFSVVELNAPFGG